MDENLLKNKNLPEEDGYETDELYEPDEDTQKDRFMTFRCCDEYYGIAIGYVNEIITIQQITAVPETVDYIKGLINLRGKIVPVIDVRLRFGKQEKDYNGRTCVIVVNVNETVVGLIVDAIADVVNITEDNILNPPNVSGSINHFVYGLGKVGNEVKLLIDPDRLINERTDSY